MENLAQSLIYGTHVLACKTANGVVIPGFYRKGLINKKYIIDAYRDFAPIYDLTLQRTYQVIFPQVEKELLGLPEELNEFKQLNIDKLVFDNSIGVEEVFSALDDTRRKWFVNECYQLLCLEHGLYPAKNYEEKNSARHKYILFMRCDFTKPLDFEYASIDEYVRSYYINKKESAIEGRPKFEYILFKANKLPKTKVALFRAMYCDNLIGHSVLSLYYHKKDMARNAALRKLDAMMRRRVRKYGFFSD